MLSRDDQAFLNKRGKLIRHWPVAAGLMLAGLAGLLTGLFIQAPYLANPFFVMRRLAGGEIDPSITAISAMLLPVVVVLLILLLAVFVMLGFAVVANEKKYIAIIEQLRSRRRLGNDDLSER